MTAKKEGNYTYSRNTNFAKKGQITIFIIVGVVLILGLVIFFIVTREQSDIPIEPVIEVVPEEIKPIQDYTLSCVEKIAEDGLRKIGAQGGFISDKDFTTNPSDPTGEGANSIEFSPKGDLKIPYWRFLISNNRCDQKDTWCLFSSNRPLPGLKADSKGDNSIESQLSRYMDENIDSCLNDFIPFYEQGYTISPIDTPSTTVQIGEDNVVVYMEYPIDIESSTASHKISKFYVTVPLDLKDIYEFAELITEAEANYTFIEKHTLNMITAFAAVDKDKLPPKTELVFQPGAYTTWTTPEVKKDLQEMLMIYTNGLQVYGTNNYERIQSDDDIQQAMYDQMVVPLNLENEYSDYDVQFIYLGWWPIYFDINQGSNIVRPDSTFNPLLPTVGLQRYSNTYDISFPVIVKITDPNALSEQGYSFMFALESNIRNNRPMKKVDDFKNMKGYTALQESLFCNENQRTSAENTIIVTDMSDSTPLQGANIVYTCGDDSCFIGSTDEQGTIRTKLPVCINGFLAAYNSEYDIYPKVITTSISDENTIRLEAWPFIEKAIKIEALPYSRNLEDTSFPVSLKENENAMIRVEKLRKVPGEQEHSAAAQIEGLGSGTLRLVPGTYDVDIDVFLDERVVIDDEVCYPTGLFGLGGEKCEPFYVEFNESYPSAGVRLNQETTPVTIKPSDLYSNKDIVFYVISPSLPRTMEDLEDMGQFTSLSDRFRQDLEPTFES